MFVLTVMNINPELVCGLCAPKPPRSQRAEYVFLFSSFDECGERKMTTAGPFFTWTEIESCVKSKMCPLETHNLKCNKFC